MKPHLQAIWDRMPPDAQERARAGAEFCGLSNLIELWDATQRFELALERRERWALEAAQGSDVSEDEQDELDERLIVRCAAGEYGPEAKRAVEEVVSSGQFGARRRTLREARKAAHAVRNNVVRGRVWRAA